MSNNVKLLLAAAAGFALAKLTCGWCGYTDTTPGTANPTDAQPPLPADSEIRGYDNRRNILAGTYPPGRAMAVPMI